MAERVKANHANPAVISWARDSAGYSLTDAAKKLGIEESKLKEWESDDGGSPSIPQLRKLSALYKRPLAVFYLGKVPKDFQVMKDLRRLPGSGSSKYSPELQLEIRNAHERREFAIELAKEEEIEIPNFSLSADPKGDAEKVGTEIRKKLGVTYELQKTWKDADGRSAFRGWRERIERAHALVFQATRFDTEEASGFAIATTILPVIVVNRGEPPTRRTFSMLHELAHVMVHVSGVSDLHTNTRRVPEDQPVEIFCNQVAAAALMPKDEILADPLVVMRGRLSTEWTDEQISTLAKQFNVSREALLRRLLTFSRTTEEFYRQKRAQWIAAYKKQREDKKKANVDMKRNMPLETVSNFGTPLVRMLLGNYHADRMTLSDVSGFLGLKTKHIPKLEQLAGLR